MANRFSDLLAILVKCLSVQRHLIDMRYKESRVKGKIEIV